MAEKAKMTIDHLGGVVRLREEHEKVILQRRAGVVANSEH